MINGLSSPDALLRNVKREQVSPASDMLDDGQLLIQSDCDTTDNHVNMNSPSEDSSEQDLQKELDNLLQENKRLKRQRLKDKIQQLRRENDILKSHLEAEEPPPKPDSNSEVTTNLNMDTGKLVTLEGSGVGNSNCNFKSQSFIFTSTNGGTLYIKPLEVSPQDLHTMSLDGIIDSVVDYDNQDALSLSLGKSPTTHSAARVPEKRVQSNGSQTPHTYDTSPLHYPSTKAAKNTGPYPRLKTGTTHEDIEARRFVQEFKARRVSHKLTQSDIGERLNRCTGARYGQSYISRLESMQLSTAIVLRMKPLLNKLLNETEYGKSMEVNGTGEVEEDYWRRKKTADQSKQYKTHSPSGQEIDDAAHKLNSDPNRVMNNNWTGYQQPMPNTSGAHFNTTSNFFISGLMSSMNPGMTQTFPKVENSNACNMMKSDGSIPLSHPSYPHHMYRDEGMKGQDHIMDHSAFSPADIKTEFPTITTLEPPHKPG